MGSGAALAFEGVAAFATAALLAGVRVLGGEVVFAAATVREVGGAWGISLEGDGVWGVVVGTEPAAPFGAVPGSRPVISINSAILALVVLNSWLTSDNLLRSSLS